MAEEDHVFKVFIMLTALSDFEGVVEMSRTRLSQKLQMSRDKLNDALEKLSQPDPESRSQVHDGRRVSEIAPNRWLVVNRKEYSVSGKFAVKKEIKSAENSAAYRRRKPNGDRDSQKQELEPTEDSVAPSKESPEQSPKTPGKVRFRKFSSTNPEKAKSVLIQPESNLTSSSTSRSQSDSLSRSTSPSNSDSGSPGGGESERGNPRSPRMPDAAGRRVRSAEKKAPWLGMLSGGGEDFRTTRAVEMAMATAKKRFASTAADEEQARRYVRVLCEQDLGSRLVETIQSAAKGTGESLPSFLEHYFSDQLPRGHRESAVANTNPFEEEEGLERGLL
jgi:hypothetical protein